MAKQAKKKLTLPTFDGPRPDFGNPPVTEVVLSLQFEPLADYTILHHGLLWDRFREQYPVTAFKPPLPPVIESFGTTGQNHTFTFKIGENPEVPRCWFENKKGTELIQIQPDRFIFNWKSGESHAPYPRYEKVRRKFRRHFKIFETVLRKNGVGKVVPNQCEVTYVNDIESGEGCGQLNRVFSNWSGRFSDRFLKKPEDAQFRFSQVIYSVEREPIGRLHIATETLNRTGDNAQPVFKMVVTARGAPPEPNNSAVIKYFDMAREYVVRGFASATTPAMHKIWERNDVA